MSILLIKPNFNKVKSQIAIPTKSLNYFLKDEVQSNLGFYQAQFGVYSYMQMNKNQKFVIHSLRGTPFMWQPHRTCAWDPTGSLRVGKQELEPCQAKINEEFCYDELFDSCFQPFLEWDGRGLIKLDAQGTNMVNTMVKTMAENATLGARLTLTAGQLYDPALVTFADNTSNEIKSLFTRTVGTCRGWVELLRDMATSDAQYSHLNVSGLFATTDFDGKKYIGDVIALYDALQARAPYPLQTMINEGGIAGALDSGMPLFLTSTSVYNAVADAYRKQCINIACINPRLTRKDFTVTTSKGPRTHHVYYIDDVAVIPVSEVSYYDMYLKGATHFAAISIAGNISLGASFANLPNVNDQEVAIMVQRSEEVKDYGKYYFASHSLFATSIADTDYIVATIQYAE